MTKQDEPEKVISSLTDFNLSSLAQNENSKAREMLNSIEVVLSRRRSCKNKSCDYSESQRNSSSLDNGHYRQNLPDESATMNESINSTLQSLEQVIDKVKKRKIKIEQNDPAVKVNQKRKQITRNKSERMKISSNANATQNCSQRQNKGVSNVVRLAKNVQRLTSEEPNRNMVHDQPKHVKSNWTNTRSSQIHTMEDKRGRKKNSILTHKSPNQRKSMSHGDQFSRNTSYLHHSGAINTNVYLDKEKRNAIIQNASKKRKERMELTLQRKDRIEKARIQRFQTNSGLMRQNRLKQRSEEKAMKQRRLIGLLVLTVVGARVHSAIFSVRKFREQKYKARVEDVAAIIITRQMRLYGFRQYRKRVRNAIHVLGTIFLTKARLWKNRRIKRACDIIRAFLLALEEENRDSGGCIALITKGKMWRVYRSKIIVLQQLWREKMKNIEAQVQLIDRQWRNEQARRTNLEIELIYKEKEGEIIRKNEEIEVINRTRKLIKLRPLPKMRSIQKEEIRSSLMEGKDLLSIGNIVPDEIRYDIIKNTLRHIKFLHMKSLKYYEEQLENYKDELRSCQRRRALLVGFSGNSVATSWVHTRPHLEKTINMNETSQNEQKMIHCFQKNIISAPVKPYFHIILSKGALNEMLRWGSKYVQEIRQAWQPNMMSFKLFHYNKIGKEVADIQQKSFSALDKTINFPKDDK